MSEITFTAAERSKSILMTTIHANTEKNEYKMTVHLDSETGDVFYPVNIEHTASGMLITLDSDIAASCSFPPAVPQTMVDRIAAFLGTFHDVVYAVRKMIQEEQAKIIGKAGNVMQQKRCMELLNSVIEYVSAAENTNSTLHKLLLMGFKPDELVEVFHFGKDDVDQAVTEYYDD